MQPPGRIWIVERSLGPREMIAEFVDRHPDLTSVLTFERGNDAVAALDRTECPRVVLVELELPDMPGTEAIRRIKEKTPSSQVIVLAPHQDDDNVAEALCAGACGYLLRPVSGEQVTSAVDAALSGGVPMSPPIAQTVLRMFRRHLRPRADYGLIGPRARGPSASRR